MTDSLSQNVLSNKESSLDRDLVYASRQGDEKALEDLIARHQRWIYNIVFRMTGSVQDAEDATQEIIIIMITSLANFRGESSFRTWLYSIVKYHVLNMKRSKREWVFSSFDKHRDLLNRAIEIDLDETHNSAFENDLLVQETKLQCLMGMLLCLDKRQRLVFILGAIFSVSSNVGSEIIGISASNFRQILCRTRKQLMNFMNDNCSLMNQRNSCSCSRKAKAAVLAGLVNTEDLLADKSCLTKVRELVNQHSSKVDRVLSLRADILYQEQPFIQSPNYVERIREFLDKSIFE